MERILPAIEKFWRYDGRDEAARRRPGWLARLDVPLPEAGGGIGAVVADLAEVVIPNGARVGEPGWSGFVTTGPTTSAVAAWLATAAAGSQRYAVQAFNTLERVALDWMAQLCGIPAAHQRVLSSGGSTANLVALGAARQWAFERRGLDVSQDGLPPGARGRVYASEQAHHIIQRATAVLGLGRAGTRRIACDARQRIDVPALRATIAEDERDGVVPVAVSGARLVLGLDALTFLLVVPLALRLPSLPSPARDTGGRFRPSVVRDARDGLAFIWRTPSVLAVALGFWVVVLFSAPDDLILPFLATLTFRVGPVAVGVLLAAASAGLLSGLPFAGPAGRRLGVTGAIVAGFAIMATGNLLTAAAPWLIAAVAAQVIRGLAIPLADSQVSTYLQRAAPPHLLGRVLANVYGGVGVAAAAGYLAGGPLVDATSPRIAFVIVGCGGLAGAAVTAALLHSARRRPGARAP